MAIHTITNRAWSGEQCIRAYASAGVEGITFWRYNFDDIKPADLGRQARKGGVTVAMMIPQPIPWRMAVASVPGMYWVTIRAGAFTGRATGAMPVFRIPASIACSVTHPK